RLLEGRPPTVREVRDRFGFSAVQTAREHLERLVDEGRLTKDEPGRARGYRLPRPEALTTLVPVLGRVPAGELSFAVEDLEGYVPVEGRTDEGELFGLRVRGESLRDLGILSGDLVIVRKQDTARTGEVVVALVDDEATVKVLRRSGRRDRGPEIPVRRTRWLCTTLQPPCASCRRSGTWRGWQDAWPSFPGPTTRPR
ncbi:MAG: transcriptional repressor LexA, partial [Planctomycetota bacterium]